MKWNIDVTHGIAEFSVKHMMISTVKGHFRTLEGRGETNPDGTLKTAEVDIDAASIDTNMPSRDEHLRSPDFFDAANHPRITFRSTQIEQKGNDVTIVGDLTMRGVSKPVTLTGEVSATVKDPWGNQRAALSVDGKLNRLAWGLQWNMALEAGGFMVSEEVKLHIEVEVVAAVEQVPAAA